jgi:hypothetical protein
MPAALRLGRRERLSTGDKVVHTFRFLKTSAPSEIFPSSVVLVDHSLCTRTTRMSVTRKSSDSLPALGVNPNSIPEMTDHAVSRTRVWEDMKSGRLPYKVVGKKKRIITTPNAIKYIEQLPDGPKSAAPKAQVSDASEDSAA